MRTNYLFTLLYPFRFALVLVVPVLGLLVEHPPRVDALARLEWTERTDVPGHLGEGPLLVAVIAARLLVASYPKVVAVQRLGTGRLGVPLVLVAGVRRPAAFLPPVGWPLLARRGQNTKSENTKSVCEQESLNQTYRIRMKASIHASVRYTFN